MNDLKPQVSEALRQPAKVVSAMKQRISENVKIAALALGSVPVALAVFFAIDHYFHKWMNWVDLLVATFITFGGLGWYLHEDLRKLKSFGMFMALLVLHSAVFGHLLRSGVVIRTAWYVPIVYVESLVISLILTWPKHASTRGRD